MSTTMVSCARRACAPERHHAWRHAEHPLARARTDRENHHRSGHGVQALDVDLDLHSLAHADGVGRKATARAELESFEHLLEGRSRAIGGAEIEHAGGEATLGHTRCRGRSVEDAQGYRRAQLIIRRIETTRADARSVASAWRGELLARRGEWRPGRRQLDS